MNLFVERKYKYGIADATIAIVVNTPTKTYNTIITIQNSLLDPPTGCLQVNNL